MSERVFNFSAGPATLPIEVLERAQKDLVSFKDSGAGIAELSHRGPYYDAVHTEATARFKKLLGAGDDWELLFLQGGASTQFFQVPMNFGGDADYIVTGTWAKKAYLEAKFFGEPKIAGSSEETNFDHIPTELKLDPKARYLHLASNNTVAGTQFKTLPKADVPLVVDMSSDILSRPTQLDGVGLIYAGAQKNLGPSGVTLVLGRKDFLATAKEGLPTMLSYTTHVKKGSIYNTPPTFAIYLAGEMARWIEDKGGVEYMAQHNQRKADLLYAAIDEHDLYEGFAQKESRSQMNVTFKLKDESRTDDFLTQARARGLSGLKGHRSMGGFRASIYSAMPLKGVETLVEFMKDFAAK